jgi:hypothetical protein
MRPERGLRQGEHGGGADEGPDHDQAVHLDLRPPGEAEQGILADHAVARDAAFAAEHAGEHQRTGGHQFAYAERNHGEGGAGLARRDVAEQHPGDQAGDAADQRQQGGGQRVAALADGIQRVHRGEGAEAVIHGVAEGEQPGVAEQHVVGEGEHHHDAHLAKERDQEAALEHQRQGQGEQQAAAPERDAAATKHHTHEPTPRPPPHGRG